MTFYRRCIPLGIIGEDKFSDVSDFDLMNISSIKARLPDCGGRMIIGFFDHRGSLFKDVVSNLLFMQLILSVHLFVVIQDCLRRPYLVPGPMSLCHIGTLMY